MRRLFVWALGIGCTLTVMSADAPPSTVTELNIDRYLGLWHQIAYIPNSFQKKCVSSVTAEYQKTRKGRIKVINRCLTKRGRFKSAEGRARINPKFEESGKLQVTFVKILTWIWPFGGDYWVLDIDKEYQLAIVGHPERKFLWILSRQTSLSETALRELGDKIAGFGYDPCKIIVSQPGVSKDKPICRVTDTEEMPSLTQNALQL